MKILVSLKSRAVCLSMFILVLLISAQAGPGAFAQDTGNPNPVLSNGGDTATWSKRPLDIRDFVNSKAAQFGYSPIPTGVNQGALLYDETTAKKICDIAGYKTAEKYDCKSTYDWGRCGWYSPHDNHLAWWNPTLNNFQWKLATQTNPYNKWIATLVCSGRKKSYCIRGNVSGSGAGVEVFAGGKSAITDANGNFAICGLYDGAYGVAPYHPDFNFNPASRNPTINQADATGINFSAVRKQCQDGIDNDSDGLKDQYDPGCWDNTSDPSTYNSRLDNEARATSQCQDKKDNDDDGLVDDVDPGCWTNIFDPKTYNPTLNDESRATSQCRDKKDNDGDGAIDYPEDFSCSSPSDNCEELPMAQCQDGVDNDNDGLIDAADPGCWTNMVDPSTYNPQDNDESQGSSQCQDRKDNDFDGLIDWEDPGCWRDPHNPVSYDRTRNDESAATTQCQDRKDNDGDGLIDAADPGCWVIPKDPSSYRPRDNDESDDVLARTQCQDGLDNDGDGLVDRADPGCWDNLWDPGSYDPNRDDEGRATTECQDGIDNDGDGLVDFPSDPDCTSRTDNREGTNGETCGLAATVKVKEAIRASNRALGDIARRNARVLRKEVRKIRNLPGLISPEPLERFYQSGLKNLKKVLASLDDLTEQLPEILKPCPGPQVCSQEVSNISEKRLMEQNTKKLTRLATVSYTHLTLPTIYSV